MKIKTNLFRPFSAAAFAAVAFVMTSSAHAQAWDGGGADASWGTAANWDPADTLPTFGTTADLLFPTTTGLTSGANTFLGVGRQIRSLTFGADVDSALGVILSTNAATVADARLTFANTTANTISVLTGSTGDINIGNPTNLAPLPGVPASTIQISGNLTADHNGSGLLTFSRPISTASAFNFTKTGSGTLQSNNNNLITGTLNVNGGRVIANAFGTTGDWGAVSSINLGGGTLQYNATSAGSKTVTNALSVTASTNSGLAFNNTDTVNRSLTLSGANAFNIGTGANLTVSTISANTAQANNININRAITGAGTMIVDGFNNINSSTTSFGLGRVALGSVDTNNGSWSGGLDIRKGTAEISGLAANMDDYTGNISIGETGNSFGAGLLFSPNANANITFSNAITVRTGGFRTIRSGIGAFSVGGDTFYTFSGPMTLEGNLNLHVDSNNSDRRIVVTGNISGAGGLQLTRGNNGFFRLSGDNNGWSGGLTIAQGTAQILGNAVNSAGTGPLTIGAAAGVTAASLVFVPEGTGGTTVSYSNNITATPGGTRTLSGGNTNHNLTFQTGTITLDGDLTVNHSFSTSDRRINLNGPISGSGGLTITRSGTSTETTVRMAGTKAYLGNTTVATTASLAFASDCVLTSSNVVVEGTGRIGGPGTIGGNLTLNNTANFYFFVGALNPGTYVPMKVNGTVTVDASFGVASIVGGSRGEAVPWATIPDGTYTLISNTASTFNTTANFGSANAVANVAGSGKTVYFQNGGGSGSGGLQIVVAPDAVDPYATWSGGAAFNDDANNDGLQNGLAFLLGAANVNSNVAGLLPVPSQGSGDLTLTFAMRNLAARGTAALQVQHSSDLGISDPWSTLVTVPDASGTEGGIVFTVTPGTAPLNNVTATIPASGNAAGGKLFGRVRGNP